MMMVFYPINTQVYLCYSDIVMQGLNKYLFVSFLFFSCCGIVSAQEKGNNDVIHFDATPSFRMALNDNQMHYGYGLDLFVSYKFIPELSLGVVCGFNTYVPSTKSVSLPLQLRIKSEFLKGPVTPYVQCGFGYAFDLTSKIKNTRQVQINKEYYPERYQSLGFDTADGYIDYCVQQIYNRYEGVTDKDKLQEMNQEAAQARDEAIRYLSSFATGSNMYVSADDPSLNYMKQGLVFDVGCGASWRVSQICSLYCGVSLGCSQAFYGIMVQTPSGTVITFDSPDSLPNGDKVIASGRRQFWKRFDTDIQFCIGISF